MQVIDWVTIGLIAVLAARAFIRLRKPSGQGCAGGCSGCAMNGSCSSGLSSKPLTDKQRDED